MGKKIMLILGNGFSIDFLTHIKQIEDIDVRNLFKNGETVPWPEDDQLGFLSYKYCRNLWNLGARPYLDTQESNALIEEVITCANILEMKNRVGENIFFDAYKELAQYLNSLFIYYDSKVDVAKIKNKLKDWGWYKYFYKLANDAAVEKVYIVTFNYDIWLERIFLAFNFPFDIGCFENSDKKFQIYKPHGSISFQSKIRKDKDAFQISYDRVNEVIGIDQFEIKYQNIDALGAKNAIIPPAGDSSRLDYEWSKTVRDKVKEISGTLENTDELVMAGISYWHVDRFEIDSILTEVKSDIKNVRIINPSPPRVINAVMTTLFRNVVFCRNCKNLN